MTDVEPADRLLDESMAALTMPGRSANSVVKVRSGPVVSVRATLHLRGSRKQAGLLWAPCCHLTVLLRDTGPVSDTLLPLGTMRQVQNTCYPLLEVSMIRNIYSYQ